MVRLMIGIVVAVLLFGGVLAADQALQNPDIEPEGEGDAADQEAFVEATSPLIQAAAPLALFVLVIGSVLAAVRAVGGA